MNLERRIHFEPAYDRRISEGGIGGAAMSWYLHGAEGAVHWHVLTNWQFDDVQDVLDRDFGQHTFCHPIPGNLCFHSRTMRGTMRRTEGCEVLGGTCFRSDNPLGAIGLFQLLTRHGDGAVWQQMCAYYVSHFKPVLPEDHDDFSANEGRTQRIHSGTEQPATPGQRRSDVLAR